MKIIFFDKVIFEGTPEECEAFRKDFAKTLGKLDDELQNTYPKKKTDTDETYFEALKTLNPFVYETLCNIKEMVGEYFIGFRFWDTDLVGVKMLVYADLETKKLKVYALSHIYFMVALELRKHTVWRIEE